MFFELLIKNYFHVLSWNISAQFINTCRFGNIILSNFLVIDNILCHIFLQFFSLFYKSSFFLLEGQGIVIVVSNSPFFQGCMPIHNDTLNNFYEFSAKRNEYFFRVISWKPCLGSRHLKTTFGKKLLILGYSTPKTLNTRIFYS